MAAHTGRRLTILTIEDDAAVAELVRSVLSDVDGWGTLVARSTPEAMAVLDYVRPDVLLVDVNLPGVSGIELLSRLRRDSGWHHPPVVMMSAGVSQPQVESALGPDTISGFLSKPFDIDDLIEAVSLASSRTGAA